MNWTLVTDAAERGSTMLPRHLDGWDLYASTGCCKCVCRACGFEVGWANRLAMDEHARTCPGFERLTLF